MQGRISGDRPGRSIEGGSQEIDAEAGIEGGDPEIDQGDRSRAGIGGSTREIDRGLGSGDRYIDAPARAALRAYLYVIEAPDLGRDGPPIEGGGGGADTYRVSDFTA